MSRPTAGPAPGVPAVLAAVLTALLVLGLVAAPPPAGAAPGDPEAPGAASIGVSAFGPTVGKPGGRLSVAGSVLAGADGVEAAVLRLRVSTSAVSTRAELAALTEGSTNTTGLPVTGAEAAITLGAGESEPWSFQAPLDSLGLGAAGVYPVTITLEEQFTGVPLAGTTTFLSWFPDGSTGLPTAVAWVVPLVGTPVRDADGVYLDERTFAAIGQGGRLSSVLAAGAGQQVSWLVDPELLESVQDMSEGYEVHTDDGSVRSGGAAGQNAARAFLGAVRRDLATADVAALGYADPDVNALQRADLTEDLTLATTTGPTLASTLLGREVRDDVAWPPGGAVERSTLGTLRAAGVRNVLLSASSVPTSSDLPYTPTGRTRISVAAGNVDAALADDTLAAIVGSPEDFGGDALALARYLAETLVITQQRPSESRTVVVAPPRQWDVDPDLARNLIGLSEGVPWLRATTLSETLELPVPDVPRGPLAMPAETRKAELPASQTDGARALGHDVSSLTDVLVDASSTGPALTSAVLRTESGAFREDRSTGAELLSRIRGNVERERAKVRVLSRGTVTLSGTSGQIPITVANDLDQAVDVEVRLVPSNAVRLRVEQPGVLRLGARKKETVEVNARATTSGTVPVEVVLITRAGDRFGDAITIQVRSTAYSRVGLVIVVIAFAALMLLAAARVVRRVRRARRGADS